jgi:hypothetical protein
MIRQAIEMMAQEPWCFHPEQIATLTDWQLEYLYRQPAEERTRQMKKEQPPLSPAPEPRPPMTNAAMDDLTKDPNKLKTYVVNQFLATGMTVEQALKTYEDQKNGPVDG